MTASRPKGHRGELEVRDLIRAYGWPECGRNSDGNPQALRGDLSDGPPGYHFEVKRAERITIHEWTQQAERDAADGDVPIVAYRRNRDAWRAVVPLQTLLDLIANRRPR